MSRGLAAQALLHWDTTPLRHCSVGVLKLTSVRLAQDPILGMVLGSSSVVHFPGAMFVAGFAWKKYSSGLADDILLTIWASCGPFQVPSAQALAFWPVGEVLVDVCVGL